jgi:hypothetical protein
MGMGEYKPKESLSSWETSKNNIDIVNNFHVEMRTWEKIRG